MRWLRPSGCILRVWALLPLLTLRGSPQLRSTAQCAKVGSAIGGLTVECHAPQSFEFYETFLHGDPVHQNDGEIAALRRPWGPHRIGERIQKSSCRAAHQYVYLLWPGPGHHSFRGTCLAVF